MPDYTKPAEIPEWALSPDVDAIATPSGGKINSGFTIQERPPRQDFNYLFNKLGQWTRFLDTLEIKGSQETGDGFVEDNTGTGSVAAPVYTLDWVVKGLSFYCYGKIDVEVINNANISIFLPIVQGVQLRAPASNATQYTVPAGLWINDGSSYFYSASIIQNDIEVKCFNNEGLAGSNNGVIAASVFFYIPLKEWRDLIP